MKCARPTCSNTSSEIFCIYHRCSICHGSKSSNEDKCRTCQIRFDKMMFKKEPTPAHVSISVKETARSPMEMMQELVGMDDVKHIICGICKDIICSKRQREKGIVFDDFEVGHFIISGNPGTGKTTIAKMMGKILHSYGVIKSPTVHVHQRESLVAAYVGQTAIKTKAAIAASKGGICFIDEAYRLSSSDSGRDFGIEAIEEIMSFMTEPDYVFVFAGYTKDMERFITSNEGIRRRISYNVHIRDYHYEEIAEIFIKKVVKSRLLCDFTIEDVTKVLQDNLHKDIISKHNASLADRLFRLSRTAMNEKFSLSTSSSPPTTLTIDDIIKAVSKI